MNLCLDDVLDTETRSRVLCRLEQLDYRDGAATAGWNASASKANEQASDPEAGEWVRQALARHPVFQSAALPQRLSQVLFARYLPGMRYGVHMDNALMGRENSLRTDLAVTVFLQAPEAYDGGELELHTHEGRQAYKLEAGQALVYPATTLHAVTPLRRGVRDVAVLWVQSLVRDASRREVLFDLDTVRHSLWKQPSTQGSDAFNLVNKSYSNLLRAWAES